MRSTRDGLRTSLIACSMAMLAAGSARAAQAPAASTAPAPFAVQATCDARGDAPVLHVQVRNTSSQPAAIVLGFTAPDGKTHVVNAVSVVAVRVATGANEDYVYVNPKFALAKGAPWIVTLAPGAMHDMELPLQDFISTMYYSSLTPLVASGTRLVVNGRKPNATRAKVWTGQFETMLEQCQQ